MGSRGIIGRTIPICALFASLVLAPSAHAFIFWANGSAGTIGRASIDGLGVDPNFITGVDGACGVAVDSRYVYWANPGDGTIGRATLDGTDVIHDFIQGASEPCGPSVLTFGGHEHIFWANIGTSTIGTALANGLSVNQSFVGPPVVNDPTGTAAFQGNIYWSNRDANADGGTIGTAAADGSGFDILVPSGFVDQPVGVAASPNGIYWANQAIGTIGHANLDGSSPTIDLVDNGQGYACGVGATDDAIYWGGVNSIGTANPIGQGVIPDFISGIGNPCGVAADADLPDATVSPAALDFGDAVVDSGPTASQSIFVENSASTSEDLNVSGPGLTGPDADQFHVSGGGCGAVPPGSSCEIDVTFDPTSLGGKAASVLIVTNDPGNSIIHVPVSGTGTSPDESVAPESIAFGERLVGTASSAQLITLTNAATASAPDMIGQATLVGSGAGDFSIVSDDCSNTTVAVGGSCQLSVRFAPTSAGDAVASLSIPSDDPTSPATVALSGTGTAPDESVLPTSVQFGQQQQGTHGPTQLITIANSADGTGPLVVGSISLSGGGAGQFDLVLDQCSGASIQPRDDCEVGVRFQPTSAGPVDALLQIPSNGSPSPVTVPLSGTGTAAPVSGGFALGKAKRLPHGRAQIPVTVPGPGSVTLAGKRVQSRTISAGGPGTVALEVRLRSTLRRKLLRRGSLSVKFSVTFTPVGGGPAVLSGQARLSERRAKH